MLKFRKAMLLATIPLMLGMSACNGDATENDANEQEEMSDDEIGNLLSSVDEASTFASIVENAELDKVFEGPAPYTIIVPVNDAFEGVDKGAIENFTDEAMKAEATLYAVAHILPGFVSLDDLKKSIADSDGGSVEMKSMSGKMFTFSAGEGDELKVSIDDGEPANILSGSGGNNGGLLMVDTLMLPLATDEGDADGES